MTVDILGTKYKILYKTEKQDVNLTKIDGYCDHSTKTIICIKRAKNHDNNLLLADLKPIDNRVLRHEILHAFMCESGLSCNSFGVTSWAENEEMIDWFALQAPKIYEVYRKLNILS